MAIPFNDTQGETPQDNAMWLHRTSPNQYTDSLKELFGGLGNALNNGITALDQHNRTQISLQASNKVDEIATKLIPGNDVTTSPSQQPVPSTVAPQPIEQSAGPNRGLDQGGVEAAKNAQTAVLDLKAAREQTAMNEVEYQTRLVELTKQMVAANPGYADIIRSSISSASGSSAANDLRRAKLAFAAAEATKSSDSLKEQRSWENQNLEYINDPRFSQMYKKVTGRDFDPSFNTANDYNGERQVVGALQKERMDLQLDGTRAEKDARAAVIYKRGQIQQSISRIMSITNKDFSKFDEAYKRDIADGNLSDTDKRELGPLVVAIQTKLKSEALRILTDPNDAGTSLIDGSNHDALLKQATDYGDMVEKMVTDGNIDGLKMLQQQVQTRDLKTENWLSQKYPALEVLKIYKNMNLPPEILASILNKSRVEGGDTASQELSDALTAVLAGGEMPWNDAQSQLQSNPNAPVTPKQMEVVNKDALTHISDTLANPQLDPASKAKIARNIFAPGNNDILTSYKADARMQVFQMLLNPAVIQGLKDSGDTVALQRATSWGNAQFVALTKQMRDQLMQVRKYGEVGDIQFDGTHFNFVNHPENYSFYNGNPLGGIAAMNEHGNDAGAVKAVGVMNQYIDAMTPLWATQGIKPNEALQSAFGTKFEDVPKEGSAYRHMMGAIQNWLLGEHPDMSFEKFAPRSAKGAAAGKKPVILNEATPKSKPESNLTTGKDNSYIKYENQGAIRNQSLQPKLEKAMSFLKDMGIEMHVFSGGQDAEGPKRTGSHRHDHGYAADVTFVMNGRQLDWNNPADIPIYQEIVRKAHEAGVTGFGAGPGYMKPGSMHIGYGTPNVWGAGGKGHNAPLWLREAFVS